MHNPDSLTQELVVEAEESGQRLDVFLARRLPDWSRSQLQRLVRAGRVEVGSRRARKGGQEITAGDRVLIRLEKEAPRAAAEALPLKIVYEDDDILVIDKPAGMVVHFGAGVASGTLVNALLYHVRHLSSTGGDARPGIVHRLDRMTSGLLIVAKNDFAHRKLAAAFKARAIRKTYTALVHGRVARDEGVIDAPVGRDPIRRVRMRAGGIRARQARTLYQVLRRFARFTLIRASPHTGRTHQIRVHLASLGHPVVGDTLYGAPQRLRLSGKEQKSLPRTFLHAAALSFEHPRTGQSMSFEVPLPPGLESFLGQIAMEG